jgi:hypothetical protein
MLLRFSALWGIPAVPRNSKASPINPIALEHSADVKEESLACGASPTDHIDPVVVTTLCIFQQSLGAYFPPSITDWTPMRSNVHILI